MMTYVDTSVVLAHLLGETRRPPNGLWQETLVTSRLCEYETWNRIHAHKLGKSHGEEVRLLLGRFSWLELEPAVLTRALEPFPLPVRTLDAMNLASMWWLREQGHKVCLVSYDERLNAAARRLKFRLYES